MVEAKSLFSVNQEQDKDGHFLITFIPQCTKVYTEQLGNKKK